MVADRERPLFQNLWIHPGMTTSSLLKYFALLFLYVFIYCFLFLFIYFFSAVWETYMSLQYSLITALHEINVVNP